jgi:hypothetical protein
MFAISCRIIGGHFTWKDQEGSVAIGIEVLVTDGASSRCKILFNVVAPMREEKMPWIRLSSIRGEGLALVLALTAMEANNDAQ